MKSLFKLNANKYKTAILIIQACFFFLALLLILRLIELQIIDYRNLKEKALQQRTYKAFEFRGEIIDRNGIRLATGGTVYDIYAHPMYYESPENSPKEIANILAPMLNMDKKKLIAKLGKLDYSTITITKGIDRDTALKIMKLNIRGLDLSKRNIRIYPQGNLASHILGYVNPDATIAAGVEKTGEKQVEDIKTEILEKDGQGKVIYELDTNPEEISKPIKGKSLVLTIDSAIQHVAETELGKMMKATSAEKGTVIVMNPKNGEILAFAVQPTYDPNSYNKYSQTVVKNWALTDVYPPGSTFKILTVASGLETGKITPYSTIQDTGKIKVQGWTITNYDYHKFPFPGNINLKYLLEHSSNVASVKIALMMGKKQFHDQIAKFGIGQKTGIDLTGESSGNLPDISTWDLSRQATIGFGYSLQATPIQMAAAVASIANNGVWVTPHVIKYETEEDIAKHVKTRTTLSTKTCHELTTLLEYSVRHSKSSAGKIPNYTVAGKTGTSQKPNPHGPGYLKGVVYTSFAAFLPSKNPQVLITVVVDSPKGGEVWGSTVAGPVFNEVAKFTARRLNIKPDAPGLNVKKN